MTMRLLDVFDAAIKDAEHLRVLYSALLTTNQRAIRSEWATRFFSAKLNSWPKQNGLWRSANANVLIVGTKAANVSHQHFQHEALAVLLRSSLVLYMAAVDKILHEALSKHFATLAKNESLDELVDISISRAYAIAQNARIRKGKGGKIKKRPGHELKAAMLSDIYKDSYLKTSWSRLYIHRNRIAHECDMIRKAKPRRAAFHPVDSKSIMAEIDFIREFGHFLACQLD